MSNLDVATLTLTNTLTSICRVKRNYKTTPTHKHGSPAEIRPAPAIHTHRPNHDRQTNRQGPKLY